MIIVVLIGVFGSLAESLRYKIPAPGPRRRLLPACLLLCVSTLPVGAAQGQSGQINVQGADAQLEQNIRSHVVLPAIACDATQRRLNRFLPQVREDVTRAARALGYYFASQESGFRMSDECWRLDISIDPGEPLHINDININVLGGDDFFADLLTDLPLQRGDALNHGEYEQIKALLSASAIENGFFGARFNRSQLLLDLEQGQANIDIEFDPQERFQFGALEIQELDVLDDSFIRRFVEIEPGTPYSSDALLNLRNTLSNSLYFSNVSVTPALDRAVDNAVPIQVSLQPRPRRVYGAGMGVTTDIGPRLRLDYLDRYLNRRGHHFEAKGGASPVQQTVDFNYTIPMSRPATESLNLIGGLLKEDNDTYKNKTLKLGTSYSRINRFNFRQNYFVNYQHDEYELNQEAEVSDLFILGSNMARTRANDAIYPTSGWRLFGQLRGASDALLSSTSFAQFYFNGKAVQQLGFGRLLAKLEAGVSWADDQVELPVSVQFFAGGDQSVRGYKYESLGPLNSAGEVAGGRHLLAAGLEYDFRILPAWKLAVFADAGNAFNHLNDYKPKRGVGLGLRWLSPIGPIRLDLASALDDANNWRLHITMGPDL